VGYFRVWRYILCILIVLSFLGIGACEKSQPAIIRGNVFCSQNSKIPLLGLQVVALSEGKEINFGMVNSQNGEYFITLPQSGNYGLRIKSPLKSIDLNFIIKAICGEMAFAPKIDVPEDILPIQPTPPASSTTPEPSPLTPEKSESALSSHETTPVSTPESTAEGKISK